MSDVGDPTSSHRTLSHSHSLSLSRGSLSRLISRDGPALRWCVIETLPGVCFHTCIHALLPSSIFVDCIHMTSCTHAHIQTYTHTPTHPHTHTHTHTHHTHPTHTHTHTLSIASLQSRLKIHAGHSHASQISHLIMERTNSICKWNPSIKGEQ